MWQDNKWIKVWNEEHDFHNMQKLPCLQCNNLITGNLFSVGGLETGKSYRCKKIGMQEIGERTSSGRDHYWYGFRPPIDCEMKLEFLLLVDKT